MRQGMTGICGTKKTQQASEDEETDKEEFWKKEGDDHSWTS